MRPEEEDYWFWCEVNQCTHCDGVGGDFIEDEWDDAAQRYGMTWTCSHCSGSGIEPDASGGEE